MLAAWLECDTAWDAEAVMKAEQARAHPQLLAGLGAVAMWSVPLCGPANKGVPGCSLGHAASQHGPNVAKPHSVPLHLPRVSMGVLAGDTARHLCVHTLL